MHFPLLTWLLVDADRAGSARVQGSGSALVDVRAAAEWVSGESLGADASVALLRALLQTLSVEAASDGAAIAADGSCKRRSFGDCHKVRACVLSRVTMVGFPLTHPARE